MDHRDGLHEGDEDGIEESVGIKPLPSLDCVGRDEETFLSPTLELKRLNDRTLPSHKELATPTLPITPVNPAQNQHSSRDHDHQVREIYLTRQCPQSWE